MCTLHLIFLLWISLVSTLRIRTERHFLQLTWRKWFSTKLVKSTFILSPVYSRRSRFTNPNRNISFTWLYPIYMKSFACFSALLLSVLRQGLVMLKLMNSVLLPLICSPICLAVFWVFCRSPSACFKVFDNRVICEVSILSLIHIWRCRRYSLCRSRWSPYH